jgi:hypothetical protein
MPGHSRSNNDGGCWTFGGRRKPARSIVLDDIEPSESASAGRCGGARKPLLLFAAAAVLAVVLAVTLGVVLSKKTSRQRLSPPLPSVISSPSPTGLSVPPVTEPPTDAPSRLDAFPPTLDPTTLAPTDAPTATEVTQRFIDGLPQYSLKLAAANASSPQAKALDWLRKDPNYYKYHNIYRLNQRYALAVLYYSTRGHSWNNRTGWLSGDDECGWYTDWLFKICDESFRLHTLWLRPNGLDGPIPAELELLTDITQMVLIGDLRGAIPSAPWRPGARICRLYVSRFKFAGLLW